MVSSQHVLTPDEFTFKFAAVSQEFIETFAKQIDAIDLDTPEVKCHPEICGALWAATRASFESSSLTHDERQAALNAVMTCLLPFWEQHCATKCSCNGDLRKRLVTLSNPYLESLRPGNVIGTSIAIVNALMAKLSIAKDSRSLAGRLLSTALAHRIFSDIRLINEQAGNTGWV